MAVGKGRTRRSSVVVVVIVSVGVIIVLDSVRGGFYHWLRNLVLGSDVVTQADTTHVGRREADDGVDVERGGQLAAAVLVVPQEPARVDHFAGQQEVVGPDAWGPAVVVSWLLVVAVVILGKGVCKGTEVIAAPILCAEQVDCHV